MSGIKQKYGCSLQLAVDLIGGKWKMRILWHIMHGDNRFSTLSRGIPDITQKMLTTQLKELEGSGILIRAVYSEIPPRVEYTVSEQYQQIIPIIQSLSEFSIGYAMDNNISIPEQESQND